MNYLAHCHLAGERPGHVVGGVLGDFARGLDVGRLPAELREGVALHRAIDAWLDRQPAFRRSRARLRDGLGHYAGVVVDVFYDHVLARDWGRWGSGRLTAFTEGVYARLAGADAHLSERLRRVLPLWRRHDLLASYRSLEGVERALRRLAARSRRGACMADARPLLERHERELAADFAELYPALADFARRERGISCSTRRSGRG